eukprot:3745516-Prymnesium_polylepis.1
MGGSSAGGLARGLAREMGREMRGITRAPMLGDRAGACVMDKQDAQATRRARHGCSPAARCMGPGARPSETRF